MEVIAKPVALTFNIQELLAEKNGQHASVFAFPESAIMDLTEHKEYDTKYGEIVKRANSYVEIALFSAVNPARDNKKALYCHVPYHEIDEQGKVLTSEFYFYFSEDFESEAHDYLKKEEGLEEDLPTYSLNVTKYFDSILQ